ncbi:MAG: putative transcriptional regulator YvhJ [bacterium ADurb.Bin363]|nr:MAG: putative transcriptional regulator YvhJ [bacterium ADurb.Bin363]
MEEDIGYYNEYVPLQKTKNRPNVERIEKSFNLMLLGLDDEEIRSDVIALLNFNPSTKKINILSVARDTRVKVDKKYGKINALFAKGGEELVAGKIEEITGLKIDYYATLNFKGFREIVDLVGGVEVEVPMDMDYDDPVQKLHIHLKKGRQILNGDKAEEFVRYRKGNHKGEGYEDGDIGRIEAQQLFIKEFIDQKLKPRYILKAGNVFSILKENMKTNIGIGDINFFIREVNNIKLEDIKTFTIPGDSVYKDGVWYYIYDEKKTAEIIEENFF